MHEHEIFMHEIFMPRLFFMHETFYNGARVVTSNGGIRRGLVVKMLHSLA